MSQMGPPGVGCLRPQPNCTVPCLPDESSAGSLPLVSISLFTPLTATEMAPYMKRLSWGQTVEGEFGSLVPQARLAPWCAPFCPVNGTPEEGRPGCGLVGG